MKARRLCLLFLLLLGFGSLHAARQPKPTVQLRVEYADAALAADVVRLLHIESDSPDFGASPDTVACDRSADCLFEGLYKKYHRLVWVYGNHPAKTADFTQDAYHASYQAEVDASGNVSIRSRTPWFLRDNNPYALIRSITVTLVSELLVLWLVLLILGYPDKVRFLAGLFLANILSLPFAFGIVYLFDSRAGWFMGEILTIAVESVFLWYFMKKAATLPKMAVLVLLLNVLGLFVGGAVLFFTMLFGQQLTQFVR